MLIHRSAKVLSCLKNDINDCSFLTVTFNFRCLWMNVTAEKNSSRWWSSCDVIKSTKKCDKTDHEEKTFHSLLYFQGSVSVLFYSDFWFRCKCKDTHGVCTNSHTHPNKYHVSLYVGSDISSCTIHIQAVHTRMYTPHCWGHHSAGSSVSDSQTGSSGRGEFPAGLKILVPLILQDRGRGERGAGRFWKGIDGLWSTYSLDLLWYRLKNPSPEVQVDPLWVTVHDLRHLWGGGGGEAKSQDASVKRFVKWIERLNTVFSLFFCMSRLQALLGKTCPVTPFDKKN